MKILITGAAGKTGRYIITSLIQKGSDVRALIHHPNSINDIKALGIQDIVVGDLANNDFMDNALNSIDCIYLMISNMNPNEKEICSGIINLSKAKNVQKIIYHSVLHPQTSQMPHHWQKLQVEEMLLKSGLDFVILQPAVYMQNILGYKIEIEKGFYPMPYPPETRLSLVDLYDVAEVAAKVIMEPNHTYATYELVGTSPLSQNQIAQELSLHLKRKIIASEISTKNWEKSEVVQKMPVYTRQTLKSMFEYYASYGLPGSNNILSMLLGRKPTTLEQFLNREY